MERLNRFIPLFLLFVFIAILAFIGFLVYSIVMNITTQTRAKMEKKHVKVYRGGLTVGVIEVTDEEYKDKNQRYVAEYKSFLEWKGANIFLQWGRFAWWLQNQ